jgi:hypothetical protein
LNREEEKKMEYIRERRHQAEECSKQGEMKKKEEMHCNRNRSRGREERRSSSSIIRRRRRRREEEKEKKEKIYESLPLSESVARRQAAPRHWCEPTPTASAL